MKFWNFVVILVGLFSFGMSITTSNGNESDLDTYNVPYKSRNGLLGKVSGFIGKLPIIPDVISRIPGASVLQHDFWDIIQYFSVCELRCTGKICTCCQKINLALVKANVCINTDLKPSTKAAEVSLSLANHKFFSLHILLDKMEKICKKVSIGKVDGHVCIYTAMKDFGNNGVSLCAYADVIFEDTTAVQVNFDCVSYDGDIVLNGRTNLDGRTLAFFRVLNPIKFVELLKKIILK